MLALPPLSPLFQPMQEMAPSFKDLFPSGTTRFSLTFISVPSPEHSGQAPKGLLKENMRGVSSSMFTPHSGQA